MNQRPMVIKEIKLHRTLMTLKNPFTTSFGTFKDKDFFITEVVDADGVVGWGESVAFASPWYSEETVKTNEHVMTDFLIPILLGQTIHHPDEVSTLFSSIRRNNMAKSALEGAVWDLYAKKQGLPLYKALGGDKSIIDVGISIGIKDSVEELIKAIEVAIEKGYKRIKLKIKPGKDSEVIREVRRHYPDLPLMADANSAYTLADLDHLKQLDKFGLMMIEQPLAHDDRYDHQKLASVLNTPICLDESIHSYDDARQAIEMGSCQIINIKIGRVGGLTESKRIHDLCQEKGIALWCGGMLEAGVGRAHNIALTTLPQFTLPGDTAASSNYWYEDLIYPEVEVTNGQITLPNAPGIGYEVDQNLLKKFTQSTKTFQA